MQENKKSHFLQSPEWAKVKTEWKNEFKSLYETLISFRFTSTEEMKIDIVPITSKAIVVLKTILRLKDYFTHVMART